MPKLSITTAWNETAEFVKRNFGALFTVALAFNALPSVALQALFPPTPGETPGAGLALLFMALVIMLAIVGTLAISSLALGRQNVVGAAIGHGFRRFPAMLGATLLFGLGLLVLVIPLLMASGLRAEDLTAPTAETVGRLGLFALVLFIILLLVWTRLILMTPVAAAEPGGPIAIIRRSWALTAGNFGKLFGFVLLIMLVAIVLALVVGSVAGIVITLLAGKPEPGNLAAFLTSLVSGLVNAAFIAIFTSLVARVYVQLAGGSTSGS